MRGWAKDWLAGFLWGLAVSLLVILFILATKYHPAYGYDIEATFTTVEDASYYVVSAIDGVSDEVTVVVPGGNPYLATTVVVQAGNEQGVSEPSNPITIPGLVATCEQMDLNSDGIVSASDGLLLMASIVELRCE